jgi:hypothetical protein
MGKKRGRFVERSLAHRRNMCYARNSIFYNDAQNLCSCAEYNGNYETDRNNTGLMKNFTRNVLKKSLCYISFNKVKLLRKNVI